jgi:hypothetical protein
MQHSFLLIAKALLFDIKKHKKHVIEVHAKFEHACAILLILKIIILVDFENNHNNPKHNLFLILFLKLFGMFKQILVKRGDCKPCYY